MLYDEKREKRAMLIIAGLALVGLVGCCIITGGPINVETCHGSSKAKCLEQQGINTKSSYAHRGEVVGPLEDVQAWTK